MTLTQYAMARTLAQLNRKRRPLAEQEQALRELLLRCVERWERK
jgi:hypothetical protein